MQHLRVNCSRSSSTMTLHFLSPWQAGSYGHLPVPTWGLKCPVHLLPPGSLRISGHGDVGQVLDWPMVFMQLTKMNYELLWEMLPSHPTETLSESQSLFITPFHGTQAQELPTGLVLCTPPGARIQTATCTHFSRSVFPSFPRAHSPYIPVRRVLLRSEVEPDAQARQVATLLGIVHAVPSAWTTCRFRE